MEIRYPERAKSGPAYNENIQLDNIPLNEVVFSNPASDDDNNTNNISKRKANINNILNKVFKPGNKTYDHEDSTVENLNVMTLHNPKKNLHRFIGGCIWQFLTGMSDGVLGALLPSIEKYYGISYAIVALIWLGNALGFITIAFTGHYFDQYLGKRKMISLSIVLLLIGYSLVSSGVKIYPLIVVGYFFCGLGAATGIPVFNLLFSKVDKSAKYLGIFHGCYGIGAFTSPLIGTAMVDHLGYQVWHYFYIVTIGISLVLLVYLNWAMEDSDTDLQKWYTGEIEEDNNGVGDVESLTSNNNGKLNDFKAALMNAKTWLVCSCIFFYQGSEVAMGGWVVTFLLDYRDGDQGSTGYVASGFWGGVTLGRFLLTHYMSEKFGLRRTVTMLATGIIILDVLTWVVPNTIAAATFASIVGFFIGPIVPLIIALVSKILPRKLRLCGLTLATAFGSSGGSVIPFIVGLASQYIGTFILHPIFLACYVLLAISWLILPNIERKNAIRNLWQRIW